METVHPQNSPEYLRALRASEMGWKGKLLCHTLATHGLRNTWSSDLAQEMGVSRNTVTAAKTEAVSAGWLEYERRGGGVDGMRDEFNLTMPVPIPGDGKVTLPGDVHRAQEMGSTIPGDGIDHPRRCAPNRREIEEKTTDDETTQTDGLEALLRPMKPKRPKPKYFWEDRV